MPRLASKAQIAELEKLMTINLFCRMVDVPNSPRRGHPQNVKKSPVCTKEKLRPRLALKAQIAELEKLMTINFFCRKVDVPNSPRRGHPQKVEMAPGKVEMAPVYTMVKLMHQTRVASSNRGAQKVNAKRLMTNDFSAGRRKLKSRSSKG